MNHIDRNDGDRDAHSTTPTESEDVGPPSYPKRITDESSFRAAIQAAVFEASANGVDVTGGWLLEGPDGQVYNLFLTEPLDDAPTVRADDTPVVEAVARAVAERVGVAPIELPPLYESVDPDLLVALVESDAPTKRTVTFEYAGHKVVVESDGTIHISE